MSAPTECPGNDCLRTDGFICGPDSCGIADGRAEPPCVYRSYTAADLEAAVKRALDRAASLWHGSPDRSALSTHARAEMAEEIRAIAADPVQIAAIVEGR